MTETLILAVPSKGRMMEQAQAFLAASGLTVAKTGSARGYQGAIQGWPDVDVRFVSSSEIVDQLRHGRVHLGITGEDLVREAIPDADARVTFVKPLGFGQADVVVAAPACWLDVATMAELEEMAIEFRRRHGHRLRVATKYMNLTRRFFAERGVSNFRIVESLGATEGAPAAGLAELIVDITTTGATLKANGLRVLDDGVMLKSEANLIVSRGADWTVATRAIEARLLAAMG
jgi:ATP phosphoribosyltransferase